MTGHRMAQAAAQTRGLAPLGTPAEVQRVADNGAPLSVPPQAAPDVAPQVPFAGAAPVAQTNPPVNGVAPNPALWPDASGQPTQPVSAAGGYAPRPASIEAHIAAQQEQANPQTIGTQINEAQLEARLQESERQTQAMLAAVQATNQQLTQSQQEMVEAQRQQAEIARQNLEFQQSQAAAAAQQNQLTPEQRYALSEQEQAAFGESLPVIDKRAQLYAEQAAANALANRPEDPRVAELLNKVQELESKVGTVDEQNREAFATNVDNSARQYGLNVQTLQSLPAWQQMMMETQQTVPGTVVGTTYQDVVQSAIQSGSPSDVAKLDAVFKEFAQRTQGQLNPSNTGAAIPAGGGQTRSSAGQPPVADMAGVETELQQLAAREASLRDAHRRGKTIDGAELTNEVFMNEMRAIEVRREEISKLLS